jgi:hypothetical protein
MLTGGSMTGIGAPMARRGSLREGNFLWQKNIFLFVQKDGIFVSCGFFLKTIDKFAVCV